ncbi:unnamed protein product [Clonostachys solani]|uniref:Xylanolytic transcriptional activator regulatory domain-containing protein n=1 Tax=Clonostachys solani TaxID=160281 RepID=A0A9N9ZAR0_9HYPO|nr:unnamed protein product [Clonostachys solani]
MEVRKSRERRASRTIFTSYAEYPCQRCSSRGIECLYSIKDKAVLVPEDYLRRIDSTLNELKEMIRANGSHVSTTQASTDAVAESSELPHGDQNVAIQALVDDSTPESFIRKMREVLQPGNQTSSNMWSTRLPPMFPGSRRSASLGSAPDQQRYTVMRFDSLQTNLDFKLPTYSYAVKLVTVAERLFGDYHTFLRRRFWRDLHGTYRDFQSYSVNRNWLCRLSLILAIAEAGAANDSSIATAASSREENTSSASETDETTPSALSSGIELFEQGLLMLKVSYEEPTVDDIEALNLASHCSYILNRRKSAYAYAGQSIRLARSLGLDRPAPSSLSNVEREHRKRVWWTAFCIDRSTSAELGLCPAYARKADSLGLPDSSSLTSEEKEEFYDTELLIMQIKVCEMKSDVIETVGTLKNKDIEHPYEIIGECLDRLNASKGAFPHDVCSSNKIQQEYSHLDARVLSSMLLRYNQCYILLLRPILLHQFAFVLRKDVVITLSDDIRSINQICLEAARSNAKILLNLAGSQKLVKYGYWDSVHLFSSLMILNLASLISRRLQGAGQSSKEETENDVSMYQQGRRILLGLAEAGNVPSKHHLSMLEEVEAIGEIHSWPGDSELSGSENVGIELGFDNWGELIVPPDLNFDVFNPSSSYFQFI